MSPKLQSPVLPKGWTMKDEDAFRAWYSQVVEDLGVLGQKLDPNPDDPRHFYDYRGAFKAGVYPEETEHGDWRWPDEFKLKGHPVPPERKKK